jgi:surfeit locus 1 family protein
MSHRTRRLLAPAMLGVAGTATLIALCLWQLQRLEWKEGLIATLEARLSAPPLEGLPAAPDPAVDEFRRVVLTGRFEGERGAHGHPDAPLLATFGQEGAGYRIIQPLTLTDGRKVMVSRGWVPLEAKNEGGRAIRPTPAPDGEVTITGALRWPDDPQSPAYGRNDNVWVARDLNAMRELFGVEPVLVVAETPTPGPDGRAPRPTPLTVDLPNNHAGYAFTWGLLAAVWASMSALWAFREMRRG